MVNANFSSTFESWKVSAKDFLDEKMLPHTIKWDNDLSLFDEKQKLSGSDQVYTISKELAKLLKTISWSHDSGRWSLMYRLFFRYIFEDKNLLSKASDPDVREANLINKSIGRDIHKMHAFVRFKKTIKNDDEYFIAWHEPEHNIMRPGAEFFQRRFGDKKWSIYSSKESAHWDLKSLTFGAGMELSDFQHVDKCDDLWKEYFSSIYNPARLNLKCMLNEMPRKYWSSMPETSIINRLVEETPQRLELMRANTQQVAKVDLSWSLDKLKSEKLKCAACSFNCTGHIEDEFGIGHPSSKVMVVTDRPLSQDERTRLSGPYGEKVFFTSVIKSKQKLRIKGSDISACQPWLIAQVKQIKPVVILSIGQKSSIALIGKLINTNDEKGNVYNLVASHSSIVIGDNLGGGLNSAYIKNIFYTLDQVGNLFEISKISTKI